MKKVLMVAIATLLGAGSAWAQGSATRKAEILTALKNRKVTLERPDGSEFRGTVRGIGPDHVILEKESGEVLRIPFAQFGRVRVVRTPRVQRYRGGGWGSPRWIKIRLARLKADIISTRFSKKVGIGMFVAGLIMTVIQAGLWAGLSSDNAWNWDSNVDWGAITAAASVFAGVGGLFDIIGASIWGVNAVKLRRLEAEYRSIKQFRRPGSRPAPTVAQGPGPSPLPGASARRPVLFSYQFRF